MAKIARHADYRLNPSRAIYVTGLIDERLVVGLTPEILKLQNASRDPITVYIDSPGGQVESMEALLRLLKLPNQDSPDPCKIITAVAMRAGSAAVDLLCSGDFATSYPSSTIIYHGIRSLQDKLLTVETSSALANALRSDSEAYAMGLAAKIEGRFLFRFSQLKGDFRLIRMKTRKRGMSDLECFIELIDDKLSDSASAVWRRAEKRRGKYEELSRAVFRQIARVTSPKTSKETDAISIKAIVDFELKRNQRNESWSFRREGIGHLVEDFFLFKEYLSTYGDERLRLWCASFGIFLLSRQDAAKIAGMKKGEAQVEAIVEKVRPQLQPVLSFFVALCHALQEGENELTAADAYWLGLIDEVVGENLMSVRVLEEYSPRRGTRSGFRQFKGRRARTARPRKKR